MQTRLCLAAQIKNPKVETFGFQITDKAHLKREGGFVSDLTLHRSVLTCSPTTSGYPGAGRRSKPLRKQKEKRHAMRISFLLCRDVEKDMVVGTIIQLFAGKHVPVHSAAAKRIIAAFPFFEKIFLAVNCLYFVCRRGLFPPVQNKPLCPYGGDAVRFIFGG